MALVVNQEQVKDNLITLISYKNSKLPVSPPRNNANNENDFYVNVMSSGSNFVIEIINDEVEFGIGKFVGYQNNSTRIYGIEPMNGGAARGALEGLYLTIDEQSEGFGFIYSLYKKFINEHGIAERNGKKKFFLDSNVLNLLKNKIGDNKSEYIIEEPEMIIKQPLNQILYGPPGTGKTFNSINYAVSIIEGKDVEEIKNESDSNRVEIIRRFNDYKEKQQIEFITFHQNYSYEDFIQGLKPDIENANLAFKKHEGIFKKICDRAKLGNSIDEGFDEIFDDCYNQFIESIKNKPLELKTKIHKKDFTVSLSSNNNLIVQAQTETATKMTISKNVLKDYILKGVINDWKPYLVPVAEYFQSKYNLNLKNNLDKNFVIIIDEINRANISRVFGELITLIEEDKRYGNINQMEVTLPSGESFSVPKNLYIIGTMNTADKSIALLDIALRRRFRFKGFYPDYSKIPLFENILRSINNQILDKKKSPDFMIGHSFFMNKQINNLSSILNEEIIPLLNEYFNNRFNDVKEILDKAGVNNYVQDMRIIAGNL